MALRLTPPVQRDGISEDEIRRGFANALRENRPVEINRGSTAFGPHRDELRFLAGGARPGRLRLAWPGADGAAGAQACRDRVDEIKNRTIPGAAT